MTLRIRVRRFFCGNLSCEKSAIFAERLLEVTAYARKTDRLQGALALIGFALGGRAGARLAQELGLMASPATLLRRGRHAAFADAGEVRVLGVDDWARHKRVAYSTILVDLERCRAIDPLPDREASRQVQLHYHEEVIQEACAVQRTPE